jgi:hypothetical protein
MAEDKIRNLSLQCKPSQDLKLHRLAANEWEATIAGMFSAIEVQFRIRLVSKSSCYCSQNGEIKYAIFQLSFKLSAHQLSKYGEKGNTSERYHCYISEGHLKNKSDLQTRS